VNSNQIGKFEISLRFAVDFPEKLASVFAMLKLVPVRAEVLFHKDCIEYVAISERFEEVPKGCIPPEYELEVESDDNGWPSAVIVKKETL